MDVLTPEQRSKNMRNIKGKDSSIELKLRRALWKKGIRYRKNFNKLPGKPDIAITRYKIAIFCDSEFWHGKDRDILLKRLERSNNSKFWINKITNNIKHDEEVNQRLAYLDWTVLRFWGDEINKDIKQCVKRIEEVIFEKKARNY